MTHHFYKLGLVSALLLLSLLAAIPIASAEVITSLNGTSSPVTTIETGEAGLYVNQLNGKILVLYTDSTTSCRMALSTDGGATWPRDKATGFSGNCVADWIDEDSLLIAGTAGGAPKRSNNDGLTFTTLTALAASGTVQDVYVYSDQIFAITQMQTTTAHFYSTTDGGTTWTDAAYTLGASGVFTGVRYEGTSGVWTMGIKQGSATWYGQTADTWTTTPTTGNGGLVVAWDTSTAGDGKCYTRETIERAWYGLFTGPNSAFSTSPDIGVSYGPTGSAVIDTVYQNQGASRTITFTGIASPPLASCNMIHGDHYFAVKQSGDTITPRFLVGTGNGDDSIVRQIEDIDASATAQLHGIDGYGENIYILYRDGSGAAARARLVTAPDFQTSVITSSFIAATGLLEADVDNTGTIIIARTEAGQNVRTFNRATEAQIGLYATTDCLTRASGVASIKQGSVYFISFGDCSGDGDVDIVRVRDPNAMGPPQFVAACGEQCHADNVEFDNLDLGTTLDFNVPDDLSDMGTLSAAPFSFVFDASGFDHAYATWTYGTYSGSIGVIGALYVNDNQDDGAQTEVAVNPGELLGDFCSWRNLNTGEDFIGATAINGPTAFFSTDASIQSGPALNGGYRLQLDVDPIFQSTTPYGFAVGTACANNQAVIKTLNENIYLVNITTASGAIGSSQVWQATVNDTEEHTVAFSLDGEFIAYGDGSIIRVVYAQNHTTAITFPTPTGGTPVGMDLDEVGGTLFYYASNGVSIFDVHAFTCADDCVITGDLTGPITTTTSTGGSGECSSVFCVDSTTVPTGFTASTFNLFLGVLLMIAIGVGVFMWTKSAVMGLGGLAGGFLIAFAFGLIPLWVVVALVIVAVAVIFVKTRGALNGGG